MNRPPHETLLLEMSEQSYHLWRHSPVTAAYLKYLSDQVETFRRDAADLIEAGNLGSRADVLRGQIQILRELHTLELRHIKGFYRKPDTDETDERSSPA